MEGFIEIISPFIGKCIYYSLEIIQVVGELATKLIEAYFPT